MGRQPLEDREYEVHPSQLRWAMHNMAAAGYPPLGYAPGPSGNTYIIIVQQPAGSPALDWQAQRQPRHGDDGARRLTLWLGIVVLVGAIAWLAWSVLAANGVRMPWQGAGGEPDVTTVTPEPAGWALPNPAQSVEDAAGAVSEAVTLAVRAVLVVAALAGLWLLRRLLGPLARGAAQLAQGLAGRMRR